MDELSKAQRLTGIGLAATAFTIWGLFPIYFYMMQSAPPLVILAFRALFTTLLVVPLVLIRGKWPVIKKTLKNPRYAIALFLTSALICANWGLFIWLVIRHKTLYASLANYITPLLTVLMGCLLLREKLNRWSTFAIVLAFVGAAVFACGIGRLPWESVVAALTFSTYSMLRKLIPVDSLSALSIETIFSAPFALAFILYAEFQLPNPEIWDQGIILILLLGSGILTALPLILFGSAMHRINLSVIGLMHYLTPSLQFICAVLVIHEKMDVFQWISFCIVWTALFIFSWETIRSEKEKNALNEKR